jgi:YegS/Rv2252/BmrU family lipid kinase
VTRPVLLLVNPAASGGRAVHVASAARAELQLIGVDHRVVESRDLAHARDEAKSAAARGELVAACGGDGFVGTVAGAVRNTDGALAVVPAGRGNDFARVLAIPSDPREAVRLATTGPEKLLDVATCNGAPFVCIASLGFDSDANRIANETKTVSGNLVYLYAALKALWQWTPATFYITIDGERQQVTGYSAGVGNTKAYGGGMYAIPDAEPDDGELHGAFCDDSLSKLAFATQVLPRLFKGTHVKLDAIKTLHGRRWEIGSDRPFVVYADGDPIAETPVTIEVEPACLRVVVPSAA